jgi:thiol-disulfide isomerase/thioredoxin
MQDESTPARVRRQVSELLQQTWIRNIAGLCVLGAIVGTLFAVDHALSDSSTGPLDSRHPQVGEAAPLFALRDSSSTLHRLDDYRGRVVWINFWATTCGPCREELPAIQNVAAEIGTDKLVVLEVNQKESKERAAAYFREIGVDLPILYDSDGDVSQQYRLLGLPYNFLIDENGVLRSFKPGFLSEGEMRDRLAALGLRASPG